MNKYLSKIKTVHIFTVGLIILLLTQIPTLLLGTDSIVPYHDQLDGEIIAYIYQAKYLFSETDIIPEFLNGAPKTSLTPPAPLAVLLFRFFSPFTAYTILQFTVQLFAYIGMFLLANRVTDNKYIALTVAVLYTFLPFLPAYGLAHYGAPMLLLCFWNLYDKKHLILSYLYIIIYASMSSLVLIGFVWLMAGFVAIGIILCKKSRKSHYHVPIGVVAMLLIYTLENATLMAQVLGFSDGFVSHKTDYTLNSTPFFTQFISNLTTSNSHVPDHHFALVPLIGGALLFCLFTRKKQTVENKESARRILCILLFLIVCCALAAFSETSLIVSLRQNIGALGTIQFSRIMWITPVFWYIALALSLSILWSGKGFVRYLQYIFSVAALGILCFTCMKTAFVKPCLQELLLPNYETISWSDYYALNIMDQVEDFIESEEGLAIHEYKVANLGIDPCAALYHGFYCVDGYSNNYPVKYKYSFRPVIAPELEKSEYLRSYYDDWGNRCYLLSSEIPGYFNIEKGSFYYSYLSLDTEALKELGCDYILSAAYIIPAEDMNLTLLREEPFTTDDSYYQIFIYKIN